MAKDILTEQQIEKEIARLSASKEVKLAREEMIAMQEAETKALADIDSYVADACGGWA